MREQTCIGYIEVERVKRSDDRHESEQLREFFWIGTRREWVEERSASRSRTKVFYVRGEIAACGTVPERGRERRNTEDLIIDLIGENIMGCGREGKKETVLIF